MNYIELKQVLGVEAADQLENAVLRALAVAQTPEATVALSRLMACLLAAVAHRAEHDVADQCMSDFEAAIRILKAG